MFIPGTSQQTLTRKPSTENMETTEQELATDEPSTSPIKRNYNRKSTPDDTETSIAYKAALELQEKEHEKKMERLCKKIEYERVEHEQRMKILQLQESYWLERMKKNSKVENVIEEEEVPSNIPSVTAVYEHLN